MVYLIISPATQACIASIFSYYHKQRGPLTRKKECTLPAETALYTCQCAHLLNPFTNRRKHSLFILNYPPASNSKVITVSKILVHKKSTF